MNRRQAIKAGLIAAVAPVIALTAVKRRRGLKEPVKRKGLDYPVYCKPLEAESFRIYNIKEKTEIVVQGDKVISNYTFKECPYAWLGEMKGKVDRGEITWVAWKMRGYSPIDMIKG